MAEDQLGQRNDSSRRTPWTKIFATFKVALDIKKLLLAAAGILVMALGWWLISEVFFLLGGTSPPQASAYNLEQGSELERKERWESFRQARLRWNLRYQLAGRPVGGKIQTVDEADFFLRGDFKEYEAFQELNKKYVLIPEPLQVKEEKTKEDKSYFYLLQPNSGKKYYITPDDPVRSQIKDKFFEPGAILLGKDEEKAIFLDNKFRVVIDSEKEFKDFKDLKTQTKTIEQIRREIATFTTAEDRPHYLKALAEYERFLEARRTGIKAHSQLRTLPWFEYRGPNPYMVLTGGVKDATASTPDRAKFSMAGWFFGEQMPVLLEPLIKFLRPVIYLFEPNAGFWNRLYLFAIILWTLFTWAFFGGAICRMAAVQLARNEKVGLREALAFAKQRIRSYFFGPVLPLLFLGLLTFFLIIFGLLIGHTYFFGDIFLVPLFYPLVLIFGLIMAVVLVGLVGYPLMNPTISTEGTDSFDALSRSYSYVYQAPWQYVWYSFLALLYGAVLIFFVGMMGSLMVYLGKWGLSQAPWLYSAETNRDREPHYLFVWTPTSFGWRDVFLMDSPHAVAEPRHTASGIVTTGYRMSDEYMKNVSIPNYIGTVFVSIWIYLFFLLILGFGYSYFWTASTLIYLLMRRHVDDTELDEVYLEDEEGPDAFTQDMMTTPAPGGAPGGPAGAPAAPGGPAQPGLQMVDSPALRTTTSPSTGTAAPATPAEKPVTPAAEPAKSDFAPPAGSADIGGTGRPTSKPTMLMPSEPEEPQANPPRSSPDEDQPQDRKDDDKPSP